MRNVLIQFRFELWNKRKNWSQFVVNWVTNNFPVRSHQTLMRICQWKTGGHVSGWRHNTHPCVTLRSSVANCFFFFFKASHVHYLVFHVETRCFYTNHFNRLCIVPQMNIAFSLRVLPILISSSLISFRVSIMWHFAGVHNHCHHCVWRDSRNQYILFYGWCHESFRDSAIYQTRIMQIGHHEHLLYENISPFFCILEFFLHPRSFGTNCRHRIIT